MLLTSLSSCGIYRQNVINAPLLQQKGQTQISGHVSFNGLDGQLAIAPANHFAILMNYSDLGKNKNYNYIDKHNFKEIGAGLFKTTKKGNAQEIFLLFGNGMTSHTAQLVNSAGILESQQVKYNRYVIQADFGNKQDKFEFALSPRLLGVHYYDIIDNIRNDYKDLSNFHIYAEGALTLRYHILKYLILSGQACATVPVIRSGGGYNYYYDFSPFNLSTGLIFNINFLKSTK